VECETSYTYRVVAYRAGDDFTSAPSATDDATTADCSEINVLLNGSFEDAGPTPLAPASWKLSKLVLGADKDGRICTSGLPDGGCALRITGDGDSKKVSQTYTLGAPGAASDSYELRYWTKGEGFVGSGVSKIQVKIYYQDGSKQTVPFNLPAVSYDWMEHSPLVIDPTKPYTKIMITFQFKRNTGSLWLDDVRLVLQ
jgi:hypothetical protein